MILDVPPPKPSRRLTAFFACFALLPAVIIAAVWYISLQSDTTQLIRQSRAAQTSLTKILLLIEDAETGQRGFLLTGDQSYLVPFDSALPQIDRELEALGTDLADDPEGQQSVLTLRTVVEQKRDELRRTIELARAGDSAGALAIVREGSGKAYMGRIRDVVARLMADEQQRLTERIQTADGERRLLQELIVCAAVAAMALAVLAIFGARRYARDSAAAYRLISSANEELRREVIERERLGEQLRQSQKMEIIGQLTGGIAHDFNNMLAVINGNLTLISRRLARGETDVGKFVDGAFGAAERAAVLTHRLLAFSRQQPLKPAPVDANRLIAGMTELLRRTLTSAIEFETVLVGGQWRTFVDANQLESAIVNLAVNARDAMPDGGKLTIETVTAHLDDRYATRHEEVRPGQYLQIAVTDTGCGMSPEVAARAFDPFFTTKPSGKGTGLGLSQVFGFVKQSGGHVKIYSEPGQGTTVKLYLPRYMGEVAETEAEAAEADLPPGTNQDIVLVVEDDEWVCHFTAESLRELGYAVLAADGPAKALRLLDETDGVRLLLTDIVMPEMNGRQLAEAAVRRRPDLRVLYFTGFTRNAIVHNGMLDPGINLLTKPFTMEQLALKVREALDGAEG